MEKIKATADCLYQTFRVNRHNVGKNIYIDDVFTFLLAGMVFGTMWLSLIQL